MDKAISQNETIQKLCINRKVENIHFLKEWDMKRAQKLMVHRKIIDEFDDSIQEKLNQSNAYMDVVKQFLTDLLAQKTKYQHQIVSNPEPKIKANLVGKALDRNNTKKIAKLYHLQNSYQGYKKIKAILEYGLQRVEKQLIDSQKQIMQMRTKIQMKIVQIQNCNEFTLALCNNLVAVFNKQKNCKPFQSETDMYNEQQMFIYQSWVQTTTQRQLGELIIQFLQFVETLEKKKLVLIKQVIGAYLQTVIEQSREGDDQLKFLVDILKKQTQNKYIHECYSCEELLSKAVIVQLCQIQSKSQKQVSIKYIKEFLKKLDYTYFDYINYLVLKQYHISIKIQSQLHNITALITVDAYLNILINKHKGQETHQSQQNISQQIDLSLKIDNSLLLQSEGELTLYLSTKKIISTRYLANPSRIECIFCNDDQRQQFLEFIEKIMY